jgi:hypothetical protein
VQVHVFAARHRNLHGADGCSVLEDASIRRKGAPREFMTEFDGNGHGEVFPVDFHAFTRGDVTPRDEDVVVRVQQQQRGQFAGFHQGSR